MPTHLEDKPNKHLFEHANRVSREDRENLLKQKGGLVWFTGLSGSGKSTLAVEVETELLRHGRLAYILDGDNIRQRLNSDLAFGEADRRENIRRIGEVAALLVDAGILVLTAFISPYRKDRQEVRRKVPEGRFMEVYLDVPIDVCRERDPKGLYAKALRGEIKDFTGVQSPYEPPELPDLRIDTSTVSIVEATQQVIEAMVARGLLNIQE